MSNFSQVSCTCWSLLLQEHGAIISTTLALATFVALFFFVYMLHKTLAPQNPRHKVTNVSASSRRKRKRKNRTRRKPGTDGESSPQHVYDESASNTQTENSAATKQSLPAVMEDSPVIASTDMIDSVPSEPAQSESRSETPIPLVVPSSCTTSPASVRSPVQAPLPEISLSLSSSMGHSPVDNHEQGRPVMTRSGGRPSKRVGKRKERTPKQIPKRRNNQDSVIVSPPRLTSETKTIRRRTEMCRPKEANRVRVEPRADPTMTQMPAEQYAAHTTSLPPPPGFFPGPYQTHNETSPRGPSENNSFFCASSMEESGYGYQTVETPVAVTWPTEGLGRVPSNPFASNSIITSEAEEEEIEAHLQELGGQMAGSILDF